MDYHFSIASISLIFTLLAHAGAWIWFASKISTKVDNLVLTINRLELELEKRDTRIDRAFDRIDEVRDMIPPK